MDKLSWDGIETAIDQIVIEWAEARKFTPDLVTAAKEYARRHSGVASKTVGQGPL